MPRLRVFFSEDLQQELRRALAKKESEIDRVWVLLIFEEILYVNLISIRYNRWVDVWISMNSRWFKVPFSSPSWRSLNPLKGSLNHPKKVTLNHQELMVFLNEIIVLRCIFAWFCQGEGLSTKTDFEVENFVGGTWDEQPIGFSVGPHDFAWQDVCLFKVGSDTYQFPKTPLGTRVYVPTKTKLSISHTKNGFLRATFT